MRTIRIGIVANEMEGSRTGVGTYLQGLLSGLAILEPEEETRLHCLLFFKGHPITHPLWGCRPEETQPAKTTFEPVFDGRPRTHTVLWEQLRLPRLLETYAPDMVFSPNYSLPGSGSRPSLVTLHDLSFEHLPAEFGWKERWRRRHLARRAARRATRLLVTTHSMAYDLEATYDLDRERIGIVPLAVDQRFRPATPGEHEEDRRRLESLGLEEPFLLFLGSIFERRCPEVLIEAFAKVALNFPDLRLVLAGHNRLRRPETLGRAARAAGVEERVSLLGYVADQNLPALYRRARLACYLSTYEGYGIPPLEALACGTAVVVSPGQALDDLWPEYPYRCAASDRENLVRILRRALANPGESQELAAAGPKQVRRLSWRRSAERLRTEIGKCLEAGPTG